ncbi:MAG TPA: alpha/beta hydrolase [Terriglobales bacterium]|nr:alpha/beta hydrolase [Terriglobales bacterium]
MLLEDLAYGTHPRQVLDLFLPERPHPRLFVFIHGGGWRGGDKRKYRALGELLSGFGYAVALPNHRLAPEHPFPAAAEDVAAAIACVHRYSGESGVRREGMFLGGHSSGAHLAALLAVQPSLLPGLLPEAEIAGVIAISGVYDLGAYEDAGEYLEPVFGADCSRWAEASPITFVENGRGLPPFFLAHAEFDYPGAGEQAERMAARVEAAGGDAQVVYVPGRDHVTILSGVQSLLDPLALGLALFLRAAAS